MKVRFILKRYSCNTTRAGEIGATIVDVPIPDEVWDAVHQGYVLEKIDVVSDGNE